MNKANDTPRRWFKPWRSVAEHPAQDDPADLGTAFGLDLSFHDGAATAAPAAAQVASPPVGLSQRLAGGRKAAG